MSINLLDLVKDQVTDVLAKQASSFLGESESSVTSALGGMMPALLGSVIQKAASPSGAQGLMDTIGKLDLDSLGNIAGLFGGGASNVNGLLNSGGGMVDMLIGNKMGGVVDFISNLSGMKSSSTSSLLKMAAPFLMSIIGNQIKGKGLSFFTDLLMGQKDHVAKALPAGLGSVLGFADFGTSAPKVNVNMPSSSMPSTEGGHSWMKWLLPILLGAAVLYWLSTKGCGSKAVDVTTDVITTVDSAAMDAANTAGAAMDSMGAAMDKLFTHTLAGGFALANASKDGIESKLITFIEDNTKVVDKTTWFDFDRLLFDSGKATLQASSQEQLTNVAEIMKTFPKVHLKIGGYTDNTGDAKANVRLSTDRAFNVKNELIKLGVDKSRLEAEGFGDKFPVGDNATEEGRQQNRRISARVSQK